MNLANTDITEKLISALHEVTCEALEIRQIAMREIDIFPAYIPTFGNTENDRKSTLARLSAIDSLTQIFTSKEGLTAGILCASDSLTQKIEIFNDTKINFVHIATKAHRILSTTTKENSGRFISALIRNHIKQNLGSDSFDLQSREQIIYSQIDLKSCRRKIRTLPKNLDMLSWTWSSKHNHTRKINKDNALKLAEDLPDSSRQHAIDALTCCPDNEYAKITPLKEQLRANYSYIENGTRIPKSTPLSGIVVVPQKNLPRLLWRDPPSMRSHIEKRISRESSIRSEPFIAEIGLHRYR